MKPIAIHVKPKSTLKGDISAQVVMFFLWRIATGVSSILLARHLSATAVGLLNAAWSYVSFAQYLTDLGFNTVLVREAANADNARRRVLVWTSLRSRASLAAVISASVLTISFFVREPQMVFLLRTLVFPALIATMLFTWTEGVMVATERVSTAALYSVIWAAGNVIATVIIIVTNKGLVEYTFLQLISAWTVALGGVWWVIRTYPYTRTHDSSMQRSVVAFGIGGFMTSFVQNLPGLVLPGFVMTYANFGAFTQGYKVPQILLAIPNGIAKAFYTRLCKAWETDRQEHTKLVLGSLRFGSLVGGIIGVGLCTIAPELVQFLWPDKWPAATNTTLAITAFVPWVIMIATPLGDALSSSNRYVLRTQLLSVQVVTALIAYLILPRYFGIVGVGVSVLLLEAVMLVVYLIVADPVFKWKALRTILEQMVLVFGATLLALFFKSGLQFAHVPALLTALMAGMFGGLVFVCTNLIVDRDLRETVLSKVGGKILKRR
jgi:O-antigen/teichoic acid export membrane protein